MTPNQKDWTARSGAIKALHDKGMTLQAIGKQFGISRERVRQILKKYYNVSRSKVETNRLTK